MLFSSKYEDWYAKKVLEQLNIGVNPVDVKVLKDQKTSKDLIISGFGKAYISETVAESASLINLCENPFQEIELVVDTEL